MASYYNRCRCMLLFNYGLCSFSFTINSTIKKVNDRLQMLQIINLKDRAALIEPKPGT